MKPLLEVRDLCMTLAGRPVLRGLSLAVEEGRVHGLVGESGAGKTMLSRVVLGTLPQGARVVGGSVRLGGEDLLGMAEPRRRQLLGRHLALIPQNPMTALNPVLRVGAQVVDVLQMHLGLRAEAARARALELLESVHLREPDRVLRRYPHELSGGMRQRILIAVAFACEPRLILADEPTTALDVTVQRQILRLIQELQQRFRTGLLFISHDLGVVSKICDRVTILHGGTVLESGATEELYRSPRHAYTRALLAATPRHDRPAEALHPVSPAVIDALKARHQAWDREHGFP